MARIQLSQVSSRFGAPMGRRETHALGDNDLPFKFRVQYLPFVDGCYDQGGAYWGSPANLYIARCDTDPTGGDLFIEFFIRASSREQAKKEVLDLYPNARFFR